MEDATLLGQEPGLVKVVGFWSFGGCLGLSLVGLGVWLGLSLG
jgi:hypothetical protein